CLESRYYGIVLKQKLLNSCLNNRDLWISSPGFRYYRDKGRVAASGTHEQLLLKSKLYKNMWEAHMSAQDWAL
ncbi:MAG: hypothetical protein LWX01_11485, partial [Deltaproteobacteria bacterium]|nr:hypothetical protein [Deltaproteobacteria bacterium]